MITKECYLRKLEITRGFNAPCIVLIIGKVLFKYVPIEKKIENISKSTKKVEKVDLKDWANIQLCDNLFFFRYFGIKTTLFRF